MNIFSAKQMYVLNAFTNQKQYTGFWNKSMTSAFLYEKIAVKKKQNKNWTNYPQKWYILNLKLTNTPKMNSQSEYRALSYETKRIWPMVGILNNMWNRLWVSKNARRSNTKQLLLVKIKLKIHADILFFCSFH